MMVPSRMTATRPTANCPRLARAWTGAIGLLLASCAGPAPTHAPSVEVPSVEAPAVEAPPSSPIAVIIDGTPIPRERLVPALLERAGREVIDELVLDARLRAELSRRGATLTPAQIQEEESILAEVAGTSAAEVRRRAGISSQRLAASLERSAMLRLLAREGLTPATAAEPHGTVRERSALVVRTESADPRSQAWPDSAAVVAVRENAGLGSDAQPISPALAEAIFATPVGGTTPVVLTPGGSVRALVLAERSAPADTAAQSRARRLSLERDAMERIARELRARPGVTVMERGVANATQE